MSTWDWRDEPWDWHVLYFLPYWVAPFGGLFFAEMFAYEFINGHGLYDDDRLWPYFIAPVIVATWVYIVRFRIWRREYFGSEPGPARPPSSVPKTAPKVKTKRSWFTRPTPVAPPTPTPTVCPTPLKMAMDTEKQALAQVKRVFEKYHDRQRAYLCDCGKWHLTTMSKSDYDRMTK